MSTFPKDPQCPPKPQRDESLIGVRPSFVAAVRKLCDMHDSQQRYPDEIAAQFREVRRHLPEGT